MPGASNDGRHWADGERAVGPRVGAASRVVGLAAASAARCSACRAAGLGIALAVHAGARADSVAISAVQKLGIGVRAPITAQCRAGGARAGTVGADAPSGTRHVAHSAMTQVRQRIDAAVATRKVRFGALTALVPTLSARAASIVTFTAVRSVVIGVDARLAAGRQIVGTIEDALTALAYLAALARGAASSAVFGIRLDPRTGPGAVELARSTGAATSDASLARPTSSSAGATIVRITSDLDAVRSALVVALRTAAETLPAAEWSSTGVVADSTVHVVAQRRYAGSAATFLTDETAVRRHQRRSRHVRHSGAGVRSGRRLQRAA